MSRDTDTRSFETYLFPEAISFWKLPTNSGPLRVASDARRHRSDHCDASPSQIFGWGRWYQAHPFFLLLDPADARLDTASTDVEMEYLTETARGWGNRSQSTIRPQLPRAAEKVLIVDNDESLRRGSPRCLRQPVMRSRRHQTDRSTRSRRRARSGSRFDGDSYARGGRLATDPRATAAES